MSRDAIKLVPWSRTNSYFALDLFYPLQRTEPATHERWHTDTYWFFRCRICSSEHLQILPWSLDIAFNLQYVHLFTKPAAITTENATLIIIKSFWYRPVKSLPDCRRLPIIWIIVTLYGDYSYSYFAYYPHNSDFRLHSKISASKLCSGLSGFFHFVFFSNIVTGALGKKAEL